MRYGSTRQLLAKRMPNYYTISWCAAGLQDAVSLLWEMPDTCRTLKSAHDILRHCVDAKHMHLAANLLDDMEGLGLQWNPWTWYLATCLQVTHLHQQPIHPCILPLFLPVS